MVSDRLKEYRKAAGLTQQALAERLHAGQSTVAQWETGVRTPPVKRLLDIAAVLGVAPSAMLDAGAEENEGDVEGGN